MTNQLKTSVQRDRRGNIKVESTLFLESVVDEGKVKDRVLQIVTRKGDRGWSSFASVSLEGKESGYIVHSHIVFQDYGKTIIGGHITRGTEKNVIEGHNKALSYLPTVLEQVNAQYELTVTLPSPPQIGG